jgi:hypothetical protein
VRGTLAELGATEREFLGEVVIVLAGWEAPPDEQADPAAIDARIAELLVEGRSTKDIVAELRERSGLPKRELYLRVERLKVDI